MIDLYTWTTPNGRKASIMLEETGLPYETHPIDLGKMVQKEPWYLKIAPTGTIPAIVDRDEGGLTIFESGAILIHLAEKAGALLPTDARGRSEVLQWLFFQVGSIGPWQGQAAAFKRYIEGGEAGARRFHALTLQAYGILDRHLGNSEYLARDYSIADIATFPWIDGRRWAGIEVDAFPNIRRWLAAIHERPAVKRGLAIPQKLDLDDPETQKRLAAQGAKIVVT